MESRKKIFFRADASLEIGYGHFIRSLALADMLKDDFECIFYTQSPTDYQRKEAEKVCELVALPADDDKFQLFLDILTGNEIVVLDNYFFTTDYQRQIKTKGCKLVCIDDMHNKHYLADMVINHGNVKLESFDCEPYTKFLLGEKYKLLRKPFLMPISNKKRNNEIVLNMGGSDPYRLTDKIVSLLLRIDSAFQILVILGDCAYLSDSNKRRVKVCSKLTAEQMASVFETSAFAILPNSTVSIEAMSRGIPLLIGYQADNQEEGYRKSASMRRFIPLGNLQEINLKILSGAIKQLDDFSPFLLDTSQIIDNYLGAFKIL